MGALINKVSHCKRMSSPVAVESEPRSEEDLWTCGRGEKIPHFSMALPAPVMSPAPMSTLLLEELRLTSELVLLNQLLHNTHTHSVLT